MIPTTTIRWPRALLGALGLLLSCGAMAQSFPDRPIRLVVSYAPGGGTDSFARTVADQVSRSLGQPVIVDNRPGAAGNIGSEYVMRAAPDGYTVMMGNVGPMAVNPHLYKMSFDPLKVFAPVTLMATAPLLVVVNPKLPVNSLQDLIALAKREPGKLNYSSAGVGSSNHLAGALFNIEAGTDLQHIPYKGAALSVTDLISGQVQVSFQTLPSVGNHVKSGQIKALAVTSPTRSSLFPDVPTAAESGLKNLEVSAWYSIVAPAGTPRPVIDRLNKAFNEALKHKDVMAKLEPEGAVIVGSTPEQFADFMRAESEKWGKVVKTTGMRAD